ncbi:hypothetical protein F8538_05570 [Edwardsiella ictaluri]|uniref:hypothetical protein n=1 Tax=Edwardsiella ictaluri TaxID=67780 RepID=UPI0012DE6952|nr:hypothetical protein [Edwardsiella ictaluri]QPW26365.1 hypothetical protein F8538_05570 [Edwardsiella ictaluri]
MKVLIYGEYSGYANSLAVGFRQLGHDSAVFSPNNDGWKKINTELTLSSKTKLGKLKQLMKLIPVFLQNDIVYIINPGFFNFNLLGPLILFLFRLKGVKIYLLCCGDDVEYIKAGESGKLGKFTFSGVPYPRENYFSGFQDRVVNYLCAKASSKIIPTMYDYELPWKISNFSYKVTQVVPLACYVDDHQKIKRTDPNAITIMHGINRREVKGTDVILSALKRIDNEFCNVTIFTPEKLNQDEYLRLFSEVDISIDQCKCHSYGMNAIYSMLHGHVVLAPADELHCLSFKITNSPIVTICWSEDDIYMKIKGLLSSIELIDRKKRDSIEYARHYHSPDQVCGKLLEIYYDDLK